MKNYQRLLLVLLLCGGTLGLRAQTSPTSAELAAALRDRDPAVRAQAARKLGQLGPAAKNALPPLQLALKDEDALVRVKAALALWKIDKRLEAGLPELAAARASGGPRPVEARRAAEAAWKQIGPGVRTALPYVQDLYRKNDTQSDQKAAEALGQFGLEAVPALLDAVAEDIPPSAEQLRNQGGAGATYARGQYNTRFLSGVANALSRMGPKVIPTLVVTLRDNDVLIRTVSAHALALMGPDAYPALAPLTQALKDRDSAVRSHAMVGLTNMARTRPDAIPVLIDALGHKDGQVRLQAIMALQTGTTTNPYGGYPYAQPSQAMTMRRMPARRPGGPTPAENPPAEQPVGLLRTKADVLLAVPALRTALEDPDPQIRVRAAELLVQIAPQEKQAQLTLIEELRGRDPATRTSAGQALERLAAGLAKEYLTQLRELLTDRDPLMRLQAARVLARMSKDEAAAALPVVLAAARDRNLLVRRDAVGTLKSVAGELAAVLPALTDALADEDAQVRMKAAEVLWEAGHSKEALPVVLAELSSRDYMAQNAAQQLINRTDQLGKDAVPVLIAALRAAQPNQRYQIINLLQRLGPANPEALTEIVGLLKDKDPTVRSYAFNALQNVGTLRKEAVPVLFELLRDTDPSVRQQAFSLLARLNMPIDKAFVPDLLRLAKDDQPRTRQQAARFLGMVGAGATEVVPALESLLKDSDAMTVRAAVEALGQVGPEAVPVLVAAFDSKDKDVKLLMLHALGKHGRAAKAAIPILIDALRDDGQGMRPTASAALVAIGPDAVPALGKELDTPDAKQRQVIVGVLTQMGRRGKASLPILKDAVKDPDLGVRVRAASAVWRLERDAALVTPALLEGMKSQEVSERRLAVAALAEVEPRTPELVAAMLEALKEADPQIQVSAAQALAAQGGHAESVVPVLIDLLSANEPNIKMLAQSALARVGPDAKAAIPALIESLRVPAGYLGAASHATNALSQIGAAAIGPIVQAIDEADQQQRLSLVRALGDIGPEAVLPLVKLLDHGDPQVRNYAGYSLARYVEVVDDLIPMLSKRLETAETPDQRQPFLAPEASALARPGPAGRAVVPYLLRVIETSPGMSRVALGHLGQIGPDAKPAVPMLKELAKDADYSTRIDAARVLVQVDLEDASAFDILVRTMKSRTIHEAQAAAYAFQNLGAAGRPAIPALRELLKSDQQTTRHAAALALANVGDANAEAAAIITESLGGRLDGPHTQHIHALGKMGPAAKAAVPALCDWLAPSAKGSYDRLSVVATLGQIGPDAAAAVPLLLPLLRGTDQQLRLAAARALAKIDKKTLPEVIAILIEDLGVEPPGYFNATAVRALGDIGPDAKEAAPALLSLLNHSYATVRVEAARALHFLDPVHDSRTVGVLIAILEQEKEPPALPYVPGTMFGESGPQYPRYTATVALGEMGAAAKPALPKLKELSKSKDWLVRKAAAEAVKKIESP